MKRVFFFLTVVCGIILISPVVSNAQYSTENTLDEGMSVSITPETPKPNQTVTITTESFMNDMSYSKTSWYVNDKLRSSSIGQKTFSFDNGPLGSRTVVRLDVVNQNGTTFSKTFTFSAGEVTLIPEPLSYTPPFYPGKSLFSYEGTIRIVAIPNILKPNGTKFKPEELVYTWKRGQGTDPVASGYGKDYMLYTGDIIARPAKIEVLVSDVENTVHSQESIVLEARDPELYIYENNSTLGTLFNKAITDKFNLLDQEVSFFASPFNFSNPNTEGEMTWSVNGQKSSETSRMITFRNNNDQKGYSQVSANITNTQKILQESTSLFEIYFDTLVETGTKNVFRNINI